MADHGRHEQQPGVDQHLGQDGERWRFRQHPHAEESEPEVGDPVDSPRVSSSARECQNEGQQVDRQRHDPQERDRGHFLRGLTRHRDQQCRCYGCQPGPQEMQPEAGAGLRFLRGAAAHLGDRRGAAVRPNRQGRRTDGEARVARRPQEGLCSERQERLEHERVADQRRQGSGIRQRIQAVGGPSALLLTEPGLHQCAVGRQQEVRHPDGDCKQAQDSPHGQRAVDRAPRDVRCQRRRPRQRRNPQQAQGDRQEDQVHDPLLAAAQATEEPVGVRVTAGQDALEEEQDGRPHGGRPAKPGQDHLADHGLNLEKQEGRENDTQCVGVRHHAPSDVRVRSQPPVCPNVGQPATARPGRSGPPGSCADGCRRSNVTTVRD